MAGWRKKAAVTVAALALLLVVAVLIAHAMFDGDHLKAMARERVRADWSRELAIETLSLRLFPAPGVLATGVALSAPSWAHEPQLAAADLLDVQLSWRALLSGHIAPGALRIEGAHLALERTGTLAAASLVRSTGGNWGRSTPARSISFIATAARSRAAGI